MKFIGKDIICSLLFVMFSLLAISQPVHAQETEEISDESFEKIIKVIEDIEMDDGDKIIVDNEYTIVCSEEVISQQSSSSTIYTVTKSKTLNVYDGSEKVLQIYQKATAAFNPYTEKVKITSHSAKLTICSSLFTSVSQSQTQTLNVWCSLAAKGRIAIKVQKLGTTYVINANTTAAYSTGYPVFTLSKTW